MPKVLNRTKFDRTRKHVIDSLSEDKYVLIANETYIDQTYIIADPKYFASLLHEAGDVFEAQAVLSALQDVYNKVSEKYKKIRSKRHDV